MSLTPEEIAAFRAKAAEHNAEIRAQLEPKVEAAIELLSDIMVTSAAMVVVDADDDLRLRDVVLNASMQCRANFQNSARAVFAQLKAKAAKAAAQE